MATAFVAAGLAVLLRTPPAALPLIVAAASTGMPPIVLRRTGSYRFAAHLATGIVAACILAISIGTGAPVLVALTAASVLPFVAEAMAGRRAAHVWIVAVASVLLALSLIRSPLGLPIPGALVFRTPDVGAGVMVPAVMLLLVMGLTRVTSTWVDRSTRAAILGRQRLARTRAKFERALVDAQQATRTKSQFLANMSHELRTPLNGVLGLTELLIESDLNDDQRDLAQTSYDCANSLLNIINDILDFSFYDDQRMELHLSDFELPQVLRDTMAGFAEEARTRGLQISCTAEPFLPTCVRGDAARLRQVLARLVSNALKFTEQGEVAVHVTVEDREEDFVVLGFEVRDTGIGMEPEEVESLFSPFSQVDDSDGRRYGGAGLGLSLAAETCRLMGGDIGVRSTPGAGSTFWFTVRLIERIEELHPDPEAWAVLQGRSVLVIDDNGAHRHALCERLHQWGMAVEEAATAHIGLTLARRGAGGGRPHDVILVERFLKDMDGLQVGRAVRAHPTCAQARLVLLVSSSGQRAQDAAREAGYDATRARPCSPAHLFACLAKLLDPARSSASSRAAAPFEPPPAADTVPVESGAPLLLVAEDNPIDQRLHVKLLSRLGYRSALVATGSAAVAAFQSGTYAAVLLDCHMPRLGGFDAAREIRRLEGVHRRTPIVGLSTRDEVERALSAGMDDCLVKPIPPAQLAAVLERLLGPAPVA